MIDVLATRTHFADHLRPVVDALPGARFVSPGDRPGSPFVLTAAYEDYLTARRMGYTRQAFLEHGIGQSYVGVRHGSYAGGSGRVDTELFLVPNDHAAKRWRTAYPRARVEVVGCPKLDTLPRREVAGDSIGINCDLWTDLLAVIQSPLRMLAPAERRDLCVAHAIYDASLLGTGGKKNKAIAPSLNTTVSDTSLEDPTLPSGRLGLDRSVTAAIRSAMSTCTLDSSASCRGNAISAERPVDLKWLFDGTLQKSVGVSTRGGSHTLRIPTTTFGSVSLAIPCMTVKAGITERAAPKPVVCTSFHWECRLAPEAGSAWREYRAAIVELAQHYAVIGHGHPRIIDRLAKWYESVGIEVVRDFEDVCRRADVYVCDNSSTLYEFASTGRPVVVVNAKQYRRGVEHGLRFWEAAGVGVNVDFPSDLGEAVAEALEDGPHWPPMREAALNIVYQPRTNGAAYAATAINDWLASAQMVAA